jgi:hypothetical protein
MTHEGVEAIEPVWTERSQRVDDVPVSISSLIKGIGWAVGEPGASGCDEKPWCLGLLNTGNWSAVIAVAGPGPQQS